ncbi:MAG: hypothetical protein MUF75_12275 [Bacteroidia bacterium]|nr:hypothetical protein [Bacteroidia bacterium]
MKRTKTIQLSNLFYICSWSTLEGAYIQALSINNLLNIHLVYDEGKFDESQIGQRLLFGSF